MKCVELVLNGCVLRPVSQVLGLPLLLNATDELTNGIGIPIEEYAKIGLAFEHLSNSAFLKKLKRVWTVLKGKDD